MKTIFYDITLNCNLKCLHCYNSKVLLPAKDSIINIEKTVNKILEVNPDIVVIQGGEPLLVQNIDLLIKELKLLKKRVYITTNATLLSQEKAIKLLTAGLSGIFFSIESLNKEKNDKIRGNGSYEKAIQNILNFMQIYKLALSKQIINDILICLSITITPLNLNTKKEIQNIFEFATNNSINDLAFIFLIESGNGKKLATFGKMDNIKVADILGSIGNNYPHIRVRLAYKKILLDYLKLKYKNFNVWGEKKNCVAGSDLIYLNNNLEFSPCVCINNFDLYNEIINNNIVKFSQKYSNDSFKSFLELKNEIKDSLPKLCKVCSYRDNCIQVCPYNFKILNEKIDISECLELKKLISMLKNNKEHSCIIKK